MTRHLLSYVLVPLLLAALVAQQAPQVSTPASQAAAVVTAAGPAQQPSASILPDGTPMKLRLLNKLDSQTAKNGDEIPFAVVNDVVVGGVTVLRRGSPATGVVTHAEAAKTGGRAGKLSFTINDIRLLNGGKVPVRALNRKSGEDRSAQMYYMAAEFGLVGAALAPFTQGTNTTFPRGTEITAFVDGDLRLDLASFDAAPSAERAGDEFKTVLQIRSIPDDAQVQIDGTAAGSTPLNVTLMAGKHEILIKKAGYSDWSKNLYVSGGTAHVDAVLEALTAK
jgi:hypothetical protein